MDYRNDSDRPTDRQALRALRAHEQLAEALGSEIQRVTRSGANAFIAGEDEEANRLLERAAALTAVCQEVEALGARLHSLLSEAAAPVGRSPAALERAAAVPVDELPPPKRPAPRRHIAGGPQTPNEAYRVPILRVLVPLGGSGKVADVLDRVYAIVKDGLTAHDMELLPSGREDRWRNAAQWCRLDLCKEGLLRGDSPHGVWEISPAGREWLQRQR